MSIGPQQSPDNHPADDAVARRLGKLRGMPVDITRLKAAVEAQIPRPASGNRTARWLTHPLRALAASLLVGLVIVGLILATHGGPAVASPARVAAIYREVIDQHQQQRVSSLEEARSLLHGNWPDKPALPTTMPMGSNMSCCVHEMGGKRMACVMVEVEGAMVSVAVANASDITMPPGKTRRINGHDYLVESSDGVNMVMNMREGRWLCVMSTLSIERLSAFVAELGW